MPLGVGLGLAGTVNVMVSGDPVMAVDVNVSAIVSAAAGLADVPVIDAEVAAPAIPLVAAVSVPSVTRTPHASSTACEVA